MNNDETVPGELITQVTCEEILISTGIQLVHLAHDLAFTDAAYGETWAVEAANRMASLSEVLNVLYKRLPQRTLGILIDLPDGMIGVRAINPAHEKPAEKPVSKDTGDSGEESRGDPTLPHFPF